jgi:hypothetical protein
MPAPRTTLRAPSSSRGALAHYLSRVTPRRVPLIDRFELDAWQRWRRYSALPRTLLLHVLLVCIATAQALLLAQTTSAFSQNVHNSLVAWLFPAQAASLWTGNSLTYPGDTFFLHTADELNTTLTTLFTSYFALQAPGGVTGVHEAAGEGEGADVASASPSDDDASPSVIPPLGIVDALQIYLPGTGSPLRPPSLSFSLSYTGEYHSPRRGRGLLGEREGAGAGAGLPPHPSSNDSDAAALDETRPLQETVVFQTLDDFTSWAQRAIPTRADVSHFSHSLLQLTADLQFRVFNLAASGYTAGVCTVFDVGVVFDLSARGAFVVALSEDFSPCAEGWEQLLQLGESTEAGAVANASPLFITSVLLLVAASAQLLLTARECVRTCRLVRWAADMGEAARYRERMARRTRRKGGLAGGEAEAEAEAAADSPDGPDVPRVQLGFWPLVRAVLCCGAGHARDFEGQEETLFDSLREEDSGGSDGRGKGRGTTSANRIPADGAADSSHSTALTATTTPARARSSSLGGPAGGPHHHEHLLSMAQAAAVASHAHAWVTAAHARNHPHSDADVTVGGASSSSSSSSLSSSSSAAASSAAHPSPSPAPPRLPPLLPAVASQPAFAAALASRAPADRLLRAQQVVRAAALPVTHAHAVALISPWLVVSVLGESLNIIYACWCLAVGEVAVPDGGDLVLAVGAALEWAALAKYVRHHGTLSIFERAFAKALPSVLRNFLATVPIFVGFVVGGTMLMGGLTERFDGIPFSSIAFFAIANGDVIRETFQVSVQYQSTGWGRFASQALLYGYLALFIYALLKTTTAITEEAFLLTRPPPEGSEEEAKEKENAAAADPLRRPSANSMAHGYRLSPEIRGLLLAMQEMRDAGGGVAVLVEETVSSVPRHAFFVDTGSSREAAEGGEDEGGGGGGGGEGSGTEPPPPIRPNSVFSDLFARAQWNLKRGALYAIGVTENADADVFGEGSLESSSSGSGSRESQG